MSLESVRAWLAEHAPDLPLIEVAQTTATVETAARALGVEVGARVRFEVVPGRLGRWEATELAPPAC